MNMCKQGWDNNRHYIIVVPGTGESIIDSNLKAVEGLGLNAYLFPCVYNDDLPRETCLARNTSSSITCGITAL